MTDTHTNAPTHTRKLDPVLFSGCAYWRVCGACVVRVAGVAGVIEKHWNAQYAHYARSKNALYTLCARIGVAWPLVELRITNIPFRPHAWVRTFLRPAATFKVIKTLLNM